ncbi:MAG TPA: hypothetical protein VE153_16750 [Myxococcus sp.]|jgi:hypothetical protein|nr:hypothetical protein [Myxococcus sp.]
MLDFLKGAAGLLTDPMSGAVDLVGKKLGLPPLITSAAKVAGGVMTGNVLMAAKGAAGVLGELSKNPPAKTEYRPSSSGGSARASEGYAPAPVLAAGASPLDPKMLDYADALRVLEANFDQLDLRDGKRNGTLTRQDLVHISGDKNVSQQLRDAARFMVQPENDALFERLDGRGLFTSYAPVFNRLNNDDRFSRANLRGELARVEGEFARYGRPERPGDKAPDCTPPAKEPKDCEPGRPPASGREPPPSSGPVTGKGPTEALDPDFREYREALAVLSANWDTFDTAVGSRDNVMTRANLEAVLANPAASATLKKAAQFFKDHPQYYDRLEMAAGVGGRDGIVGRPDVTAALRQADTLLADSDGGSRVGGRPVGGKGGSSVRSIIDNPNMSIEDKIQAVLMSISKDTDDEILEVMRDMSSQREERAGLGTSEADRKKAAKLDSSMQELELRLQRLMEKRKAMFDLMSNMSSKFNEMAKTAISNLRSA